jgi:hypothetical protein
LGSEKVKVKVWLEPPPLHFAAEHVSHDLLTVTDAEDGLAGSEDRGIDRGAGRIVNARGAARNNQALGGGEFASGRLAGTDLGIDTEVAYFACFEVSVLAARMEDDDLRVGVQVLLVASWGSE